MTLDFQTYQPRTILAAELTSQDQIANVLSLLLRHRLPVEGDEPLPYCLSTSNTSDFWRATAPGPGGGEIVIGKGNYLVKRFELGSSADNLRYSILTLDELAKGWEPVSGSIHLQPVSYPPVDFAKKQHDAKRGLVVNVHHSDSHLPTAAVTVVSEPEIYPQNGGKHSYFLDVIRHTMRLTGDVDATERLTRYEKQVQSDKRYATRGRLATFGDPTWSSPPWWMVEMFDQQRGGFLDLLPTQPLPPGTDSISIPKVMGANPSADQVIIAPVRTVAGMQGISAQLIDQCPIALDPIMAMDLVMDYRKQMSLQILDGLGERGQVKGIRKTEGISQLTGWDGLSAQGLKTKIVEAIDMIKSARFLPPDVIVMHPKRWSWCEEEGIGTTLDTPRESWPGSIAVGTIRKLPVVLEAEINTGTIGGDDKIYVARSIDLFLLRSGPRVRALEQSRPVDKLVDLSYLLQFYGYVAFTAERYPQSMVEIGGLGLL